MSADEEATVACEGGAGSHPAQATTEGEDYPVSAGGAGEVSDSIYLFLCSIYTANDENLDKQGSRRLEYDIFLALLSTDGNKWNDVVECGCDWDHFVI